MGGQVIQTPALGMGQTWQDVTASRAVSTVYTNTTGRSIHVKINFNNGGTTFYSFLTVAGRVVSKFGNSDAGCNVNAFFWTLEAIVPPGATYSMDRSGTPAQIISWEELR